MALRINSLYKSLNKVTKVASLSSSTAGASNFDRQKYIDGGQKQNLDAILAGSNKYAEFVASTTKMWKANNEIYYGPDRDMANFPPAKQPINHPKVRMGLFPENWFQAFYDKTGVTGPYVLVGGSLAYLLSKELWVMDHEFFEVPVFLGAVIYVNRKFGAKISQYLRKVGDDQYNAICVKPVENLRDAANKGIAEAEESIANQSGMKHLFAAKRENVELQLEMAYRERLHAAFKTAKARLDYQVEKENTKRNFQQQHMLNWIENSVRKGITAQQEKDTLNQCITDLKLLSKQHSGTISAA